MTLGNKLGIGSMLSVKLASTDSPGVSLEDSSLLGCKDFLSLGVEVSLDERFAHGFEDGLVLGIKLSIGSTLGLKLASTENPRTGYKDGS
jgi:hypothetical protein